METEMLWLIGAGLLYMAFSLTLLALCVRKAPTAADEYRPPLIHGQDRPRLP
jgi:hypothetical protein